MNILRSFRDKFITSPGKKVVVENFFSLSILQFANYLLPLITFPYLVRILGPEKYGLVSFAQAFIQYFVLLTDYGFNLSATREISVYRNDKEKLSAMISSIMAIKIVLALISFAIICLLIFMIPRFRDDWLLYVLTFGIVAGNVLFPVWFFQGMERMKYITVLNLIAKSVFTVSIFIIIKNTGHYLYVPILNSLGYICAGVLSVWILYKDFGMKFIIPSFDDVRHQLEEGWHVFISTIAISAYSNTRVFVVGIFTNNTITGFYTIAEKLINIIQSSFLIPLVQAVYPRLSSIYAIEPNRSYGIMKKLQHYTTLVYFVFLPAIFIFAPQLVGLIARTAYPESVLSLQLLLIATFFTSANAFRVQFLLVSGQKEIFANIHLIAGLTGIVLTILGVYYYSYAGPALALIFIEIMVLALTVNSLHKKTI